MSEQSCFICDPGKEALTRYQYEKRRKAICSLGKDIIWLIDIRRKVNGKIQLLTLKVPFRTIFAYAAQNMQPDLLFALSALVKLLTKATMKCSYFGHNYFYNENV